MSQPHGPPSDPKATTVELFFDLVFVYAITQVTTLLLSDLSPLGFAKSGLVLFLVWWAWSQYTWMANAVGPACRSIRFGMLVASVPTFFVAFTLPDAYAASALWFCLSYFLVREIGLLLYWFALTHDRHQQNALRTFIPFASVAPTLVLVGGFVPETPRTILYAVSMIVDILGALNAGKGNFRISASHFAERYGLLVIIAIGESVIAIGIGAAQAERTPGLIGAITIMLAGVGILFWSYFDWIADAAEHRLAHIDASPAQPPCPRPVHLPALPDRRRGHPLRRRRQESPRPRQRGVVRLRSLLSSGRHRPVPARLHPRQPPSRRPRHARTHRRRPPHRPTLRPPLADSGRRLGWSLSAYPVRGPGG